MKNLTFNKTLTIEQFKGEKKVSKLEVKRNPKTNKLFFQFGSEVGAVSSKGIPQHPMISHVTGDSGSSFWMLHEEATGGAEVIATF